MNANAIRLPHNASTVALGSRYQVRSPREGSWTVFDRSGNRVVGEYTIEQVAIDLNAKLNARDLIEGRRK